MNRRTLWRLCYTSVVVLSVLTFTPLILPLGTHIPEVFGVPYTLWTGIVVTMVLVVLTYLATQLYPPERETD